MGSIATDHILAPDDRLSSDWLLFSAVQYSIAIDQHSISRQQGHRDGILVFTCNERCVNVQLHGFDRPINRHILGRTVDEVQEILLDSALVEHRLLKPTDVGDGVGDAIRSPYDAGLVGILLSVNQSEFCQRRRRSGTPSLRLSCTYPEANLLQPVGFLVYPVAEAEAMQDLNRPGLQAIGMAVEDFRRSFVDDLRFDPIHRSPCRGHQP